MSATQKTKGGSSWPAIPADTVWLDDRYEPVREEMLWVKTVDGLLEAMRAHRAEHCALDHNLGMYDTRTGTDALLALIAEDLLPTCSIQIISGATDARQTMGQAIVDTGLFEPEPLDHPLGPFYVRKSA